MNQPPSTADMRQLVTMLMGVLILGIAIGLVYGPAARGPFIFDDSSTIVHNQSIRQVWPLVGVGDNYGPLNPPPATPVYGRPLVNLSFAVNYHFGRLDPFGYRVVHIVVHFVSAILLWGILFQTLRLDYFGGRFGGVAGPLAFAAALLWALHPLDTESVVYVTQRTELLMGMFYLATLLCSIGYWKATRGRARAVYLVLATLSCVSGMLCKEMIASAPAMVLLYQRTFVAGSFRRALRESWPLYVGLALAWIPAIVLHFVGWRTPGAGFGLGLPAHEWWLTQTKVIFLYLKLTVWPWPLVIHYEIPILKSAAEAWPWLLATAVSAVCTLWLLWRRSAVGFVAIWFFAVLSPTLLIPLPGEAAVERRMYVPLAALVPLLVVGAYRILDQAWHLTHRKHRESRDDRNIHPAVSAIGVAATIALAIGFAWLGSRRLEAYRSELALWDDAAVHQPHDPLVRTNLGIQLAAANRVDEAIAELEVAVKLDPESHLAHFNLARALEVSSRPQDAVANYRAAIKLRPDDASSHYNLARLLEDSGYVGEAEKHYRQAIAAQSEFSAAYTNLGILLLGEGRIGEAIENFEAALRWQEDLSNYMNLILAYAQQGQTSKAVSTAERALELARVEGNQQVVEKFEAALEHLQASSNTR